MTQAKTNETTTVNEQKRDIEVTTDAGGLTLRFKNGEQIAVGLTDLNDDILKQATLHGLKQKLVDAAAISRDTTTGRAATIADKFAAVKAVADRLLAGAWNQGRSEGGAGRGGLLFRALLRVYPAKTAEQIEAFLASKTDAEKTALRSNPKIATAIEAIRAADGKAAKIDSSALLDELE